MKIGPKILVTYAESGLICHADVIPRKGGTVDGPCLRCQGSDQVKWSTLLPKALEAGESVPKSENQPLLGAADTPMREEKRDAAAAIGDTELYEHGVRVTRGGRASVERAAELAVFLASHSSGTLSGRIIQATTDDLLNRIPLIREVRLG